MNILFEPQENTPKLNPDSFYNKVIVESILEKWNALDELKADRTQRLNFLSLKLNGGKNSGNHNPGQGRGVGKPNGGSSLKNYGKNDSKIRELRKSLAEKKDTVAWYRGETGTSFEMGEVERKTVKEEVEEAINMIQTYKEAIKSVPDAAEKLKSAMETEEHRLDSLIKRINEDSDTTITRDNVLEEIDNVVSKVEKDYNDAYKELYELRKNPYQTIDISEQYRGIQPSGKNITSESERLKISRETIGDFDSGIASEWLQGETYEVKSDIRKEIEKSQKLRDAMLSQMYYESDSKMPYKEWLETPVTLKRQQNTDIPRDTDTFLSFSQAKDWNGENTNDTVFPADIITVKVKPKDTFGTIPVYEGEAYAEREVLVPSEVFLKSLNLDVQSTKRQNRIQILSLKFNGGKNSGNHNPGQGRGVGKPGSGYTGVSLFESKIENKLSEFNKLSLEEKANFINKALESTTIDDIPSELKENNSDFQVISLALGNNKKPSVLSEKDFDEKYANLEKCIEWLMVIMIFQQNQ
ncbi:MAG: hypothetical protein IJ122_06095 [Methanobrevibacter sp.]|nr:hypothetical protein [Methanobrevibacter sp.]